jgi:membrane protease subunit (stomatin/prohibitin family)
MPIVIEWLNKTPEAVIYSFPADEIEWGSVLIVHEDESAVFFRDGKAYDVLGPGRHVLTTLLLPLLTGVLVKIAGYDRMPFKANVIFVSTKELVGKFGFRAQTTDLAPLMAHGSYWFKVSDPILFITQLSGSGVSFGTDSVTDFVRGYINENSIDSISKYDLQTVFTKLDVTSMEVRATVATQLERLGLNLVDLKFEGIDTEPAYRDRLFFIKQMAQSQGAEEVLRMDTAKEVAKELGKSSGAAIGTGMVLIPQVMTPPAAPPPPPSGTGVTAGQVVCPKCSRVNPPDSKFCMFCGSQLPGTGKEATSGTTKKCPECNSDVPGDANFCLKCGHRFQ